jgi:hypothetical protein
VSTVLTHYFLAGNPFWQACDMAAIDRPWTDRMLRRGWGPGVAVATCPACVALTPAELRQPGARPCPACGYLVPAQEPV